jgi:CHASE3 domain sensor protein
VAILPSIDTFNFNQKAAFWRMLRTVTKWCRQWWGDLSLRNKGIVSFLLPIGALLLNSALLYRFDSERQNASFWVMHTFQVQLELQHILVELSSVVTDSRIYRLTSDQVALERAHKSAKAALAGIDAVQRLTADDFRQQKRVPTLRVAVEKRLQYIFEKVTERRFSVADEINNQARHRAVLDLMNQMMQEEATLMTIRMNRLNVTQNYEVAIDVSAFLVVVVSSVLGIWLFLRGIARRISTAGRQVSLLAEGVRIERTDQRNDELACFPAVWSEPADFCWRGAWQFVNQMPW